MAACVCVYDDDFPRSPKTEMVNSTNPVAFFSLSFFIYLILVLFRSPFLAAPKKKPRRWKDPPLTSCCRVPTIFLRTDLQMVTWCVLFSTGNKQGGRERERENLLKTPAKRKKKKVSERKHCVSPGSILIRVQLSSSSPLVPIEIAPINSRPNEKGCWHLLCVREEKKISFFLFTSGTMERINDAQVETIFFHLSLYMYRPMCIYLFIVRVFGCGQPLP